MFHNAIAEYISVMRQVPDSRVISTGEKLAGDEDTHANHGKSIFGDRKSGKTAIVEGDSNTKFGNRGPIGEKAIFQLDLNGGSHGLNRDWLIVALGISESGIRDDQIVV